MWCSLTSSCLITIVKQHCASLVLGWVTLCVLGQVQQIYSDSDDHMIFNDLPCKVQLHRRFINFTNKAMRSSNDIIKFSANSAISGSRSSTFRNLNYIRWKYDININDSCISALFRAHYNVVNKACYCTCMSDDCVIISLIRSLKSKRDDKFQENMPVHFGLSVEDVNSFLNTFV